MVRATNSITGRYEKADLINFNHPLLRKKKANRPVFRSQTQFIQSSCRCARRPAGMPCKTYAMLIASHRPAVPSRSRRRVLLPQRRRFNMLVVGVFFCFVCCSLLLSCWKPVPLRVIVRCAYVRTIYSLFRAVTFCVNSRARASSSTSTYTHITLHVSVCSMCHVLSSTCANALGSGARVRLRKTDAPKGARARVRNLRHLLRSPRLGMSERALLPVARCRHAATSQE